MDGRAGITRFNAPWPRFYFRCVLLRPNFIRNSARISFTDSVRSVNRKPHYRMKVLVLNRAFYPDVVSSGQHLADRAVNLARSGNEVTVVTAASGYDDPSRRFSYRESGTASRSSL